MKKQLTIAAAVALVAIGFSAQATVIIPQTDATYTSDNDVLTIQYEVTETAGVYTYCYDISTSPGVDLTSFTIGNVYTPTAAIADKGQTIFSTVTGNSVIYDWNGTVTADDVSFTSDYAPGLTTMTLNDDDIDWASGDLVPSPEPVPEASTIMAGALMILPLGAGAFRVLRKERVA